MLIRREHFVHLYSYIHIVTRMQLWSTQEREKEGKKHGWTLWKITFIHWAGNNRQFFRATVLSLVEACKGARDPLTEFTSTSKSPPPHRSNHSTSHTRLILTRFSSSIVGRLLTSTLARSSGTSEIWTCRLRLSAWRNGMRQGETMGGGGGGGGGYAKKVEYKLVFREREV